MGAIMAIWKPFEFQGRRVMSFKGLDRALGQSKGGAFRAFKYCDQALIEGEDYLRLDAAIHDQAIESLKAAGRVYQTSVNVVLVTESGLHKIYPPTEYCR